MSTLPLTRTLRTLSNRFIAFYGIWAVRHAGRPFSFVFKAS